MLLSGSFKSAIASQTKNPALSGSGDRAAGCQPAIVAQLDQWVTRIVVIFSNEWESCEILESLDGFI